MAIAVVSAVAPVAKAVSVGDEVTSVTGPGYGLKWENPESTGKLLPRMFWYAPDNFSQNFEGLAGYCVDPEHAAEGEGSGVIHDWDGYVKAAEQQKGSRKEPMPGGQEAFRKINWIAHHGYPYIGIQDLEKKLSLSGLNRNQAIIGTQLAIWHFSNGIDFSGTFNGNSKDVRNIKALYTYLTGESNVGQDEVKDSSNLTGKFVSHPGQDQVIIDTNPNSDSGRKQKPSIKTEAKFAEGSSRVVNGAVVTDTVTYENLVPGKKYHLDATLMSKDGKTELGTGEAEFTPESANGSTTVDIKVENAEKPVDAAVAFEELTSVEVNADGDETPDADTPNEIADHKDINDEKQTVTSKETLEPSIKTEAKFAEGSSRVVNGAVVTDTVTYENLVPGKKYHLDAT
ncbi:VaFE repeat-containing surface-anchored protein, partial [Corynebacterium sp. MSK122]|uniref:VaFE repeat-containing surface-anchored protein n=1 Tax=Corynebacterium sp. MSK122 TaxID=3050206 RepID=UPI003AEFD8B0